MTRLRAPEGLTHLVVMGHTYTVPEDGIVEPVSPDHLSTLHTFGLRDVDDAIDALPTRSFEESVHLLGDLLEAFLADAPLDDARGTAAREFLDRR